MIIDSIELKNYRQYRDEKIEFTFSGNKNLSVIQGANGVGKTNLLNAISWCFYGKEKHLGVKHQGFPLLNTSAFNESKPCSHCDVGVRVQMRNDEGEKIIISRAFRFEKSKEDKLLEIPNRSRGSTDGSVFQVLKEEGKDLKHVEYPQLYLKKLIPESIEEYFFFDGERLNEYFESESGKNIRDAVFKISQVGLLERAIEHISTKRADFLREAHDLSSKAEEIKLELEKREEYLKEYGLELNNLKGEAKEAELKEKECSDKLKSSPIANVGEYQKERDELNNSLEQLEQEIEEEKKEKFEYLIKMAPLIFAYNPIIKMQKMIEEKIEAGEIPPDIKRVLIKQLLEKGRCICGNDISLKNKSREKLEQLLKDCDEIGDIAEELIEANTNLSLMLEGLKNFKEEQIDYGKKIKNLEQEIESKNKRLKTINEEIGKYDIGDIKLWENRLQEYRSIKEDKDQSIGEYKHRIRQINDEISVLKNELDKELKKEQKYRELRRTLAFCEVSMVALSTIKEAIMTDIRKEIEDNTRNQFFELIWKKEIYKDVKIDDDYNISVIDKHGMEGIGTLSAGERQVLALSFMAALNSVSGFNVPIIIDTPLGRISKEPKRNIANKLMNYLKDKQVILLVTDEEYTPEVRERLSQRIGREYLINFKETEGGGEAKVVQL